MGANPTSNASSADYQAFIAAFYNNAPNGYHSLDANGYYVKINDTALRLLGYTADELIGKKRFIDLVIPDAQAQAEVLFEAYKKAGNIRNAEFQLVAKDGHIIPVLLNSNAIYDEQGNFVTTHSVIIDISDSKRLEKELLDKNQELNQLNEQLFQRNQEKNRFIGIASHDLQNPLTTIKLIAGKFKKTSQNLTESQKRWIDDLVSTSERMNALIKNMLNLTRLERGIPEIKACNIVEILTTTLSRFEEIAARKNIRLHFASESADVSIQTDPDYVLEIVENLVSNAIKFSFPASEVSVQLREEPSQIAILVNDQGPGIPVEEQALLFGKFQKLSPKPTANESSTGLGLSIVQELCEKLQGKVYCQSTVGVGSTFIVCLPLLYRMPDFS